MGRCVFVVLSGELYSWWVPIGYFVENSQNPKLIKQNDISAPKSHETDPFKTLACTRFPWLGTYLHHSLGEPPRGSPTWGASATPCFGFFVSLQETLPCLGGPEWISVPYS